MKKLLLSLFAALAFMITMPVMAMPTSSVAGDTTGSYPLDGFYSNTDVTSLNAEGIVTAKSGFIQAGALSVPAIAYEKPRTMKLESKFKGNEKITKNVIVHAYPGRYQYSGVTTA